MTDHNALVAALTGVDAALIEKAALAFARGPSLLWLGQGGQRQPKGGNVFRVLPLLNIATGQLGNWASHTAALAFKSLKLDTLWYDPAAPKIRVEAEVSEICRSVESTVISLTALMKVVFPALNGPVTTTFTDCMPAPS